MISAASLLDPASNPVTYVTSVLTLYAELPDTPSRTNPQDQRQARSWFDSGISLSVVEAALLLASLRRLRPPGRPSLPRIRSLAYFQPVIEELLSILSRTATRLPSSQTPLHYRPSRGRLTCKFLRFTRSAQAHRSPLTTRAERISFSHAG